MSLFKAFGAVSSFLGFSSKKKETLTDSFNLMSMLGDFAKNLLVINGVVSTLQWAFDKYSGQSSDGVVQGVGKHFVNNIYSVGGIVSDFISGDKPSDNKSNLDQPTVE